MPPFQAIPILPVPALPPPELEGGGAAAGVGEGAGGGGGGGEGVGEGDGEGLASGVCRLVALITVLTSMWAFAREIDVAEDSLVGTGALLLVVLALQRLVFARLAL